MSSFARGARKRKERAAIKSLTRDVLPVYVDLIEYIKLRTRCSTHTAEVILLSGALKSDSHVIGRKMARTGLTTEEYIVDRYVPKEKAQNIQVVTPPKLAAEDA